MAKGFSEKSFKQSAELEIAPETLSDRDNNESGGREIRGLEPRLEKFSCLKEGEDYEIGFINERIKTKQKLQDYLVFVNPSEGDIELTVTPPHWRTVTEPVTGELQKDDGSKEYFFEANTKGVGYLKPSVKGGSIEDYDDWLRSGYIEGERILGLCIDRPGKRSAEKDAELSEFLINRGLRTEAHWAIADLKRLPYKGEVTDISKLQEMEVLPRLIKLNNGRKILVKPIVLVRLLKNNTRIEEALLADERRREIFQYAFDVHNREAELNDGKKLSIGDRRDEQEFFRDFCRKIGYNLAIMLNEGYSHSSLHSSNITMAAEFADIEPMMSWRDDTKVGGWNDEYGELRLAHIKDMRDVSYSMRRLFKAARAAELSTGSRETLVENILAGFKSGIDYSAVEKQHTNAKAAFAWLQKIMKHALVERKNLPSLQTNPISDWEIFSE